MIKVEWDIFLNKRSECKNLLRSVYPLPSSATNFDLFAAGRYFYCETYMYVVPALPTADFRLFLFYDTLST